MTVEAMVPERHMKVVEPLAFADSDDDQ